MYSKVKQKTNIKKEDNYLGYIKSNISRQIAYGFCVNF